MANLSAQNVQDICDVYARQYDLMATLLGTDEVTADTWRFGAKKVWDIALAGADAAEAQSPLTNIAGVANDARVAFAPATFVKERLQSQIQGLQAECDGSIGTFLNDNTIRVHPSFGDLYFYVAGVRLSPIAVVFPPVQVLAHIVRGASAFTYSAGTAVDTTKYGGAQLRLRAKTVIGGADCVLTLTCQKADGGSEQQVVTMPSTSAIDTYVDVGSASNIYTAVTNITATGGTNLDSIDVETKLTRSIATILTA